MKSIDRLQVIIDMAMDYTPPPPSPTLTEQKPDTEQKGIAEKVRDKQSH